MNEKRKVEEECMNIAIKQNSILHGYKIDDSRTAKGIEEERPDFILTRGDSRIGVEHFLVDTLVKEYEKKGETIYGSFSRQHSKQMQNIYERYKDGNINGNEDAAVKDILSLASDSITAQSGFICGVFESEFVRIFGEHLANVNEYRELHHDISKLGFLCEIRIPINDYSWVIHDNGRCYKQVINGIPMLGTMSFLIDFALRAELIDFVIITTIPIYASDKAKSCCYTKDSEFPIYDGFSLR